MPDKFEGEKARAARDAALRRVADRDPDWQRDARTKVRALEWGWKGTGEDIRVHLVEGGFREPHHHNAWGSMVKTCFEHGWLVKVGRRNMKTVKSHARNTPVYRRTRKP